RCVGFAKSWGFGCLVVTNLYAFRATDPADLWNPADPVGPRNDEFLRRWASVADRVVLAWSKHGVRGGRGDAAMTLLRPLSRRPSYRELTSYGQPGHPL